MTRLKFAKGAPMPGTFARWCYNGIAQHCVAKLMVHDRSYPLAGLRLKELSCNYNSSPADIA
jgi:hypothetical protein